MPKAIVIEIDTDEKCSYGCGETAKYKNKSGNLMCKKIPTQCPENKKKNSEGSKKSYENGSRRPASNVYQTLPEETKDRMNWNKGNFNADFSFGGKGSHKKVLIKERGYQCERCLLSEWLCEPIPLELEHCDGNNFNNERDNLLLLCPNCHAKTKFYRGKNVNNSSRVKVSDEAILQELANGLNIRQVLLNVGLTPKSANYQRVYDLKFKLP